MFKKNRNNNVENIGVDVIVLCYNPSLDKLKKTLNSIFNQKQVNVNMIIADDGSKIDYKNDLLAWINNTKHTYKLSFLDSNVGIVKNIYYALQYCVNKYVKLISPGDYLFDEYTLYDMVSYAYKKKSDILFGRAQYYNHNDLLAFSAPIFNSVYFFQSFIKRAILKYSMFVCGASLLYSLDILNKYIPHLISIGIIYVEDNTTLHLAALENKRINSINRFVVWYEFGSGVSTKVEDNPFHKLVDDDFSSFYKELYNLKSFSRYKRYRDRLYPFYHRHLSILDKVIVAIRFPGLFIYAHCSKQRKYKFKEDMYLIIG